MCLHVKSRGLGLARYHAVWMQQVLSVQYALHPNPIWRMFGRLLVHPDGARGIKDRRLSSFYFI